MTAYFRPLVLALGVALLPAGAALTSSSGISDTDRAAIQTRLSAEGYEVRKIDSEDGMIEVYSLRDGKRIELYLDAALNVVRTKTAD